MNLSKIITAAKILISVSIIIVLYNKIDFLSILNTFKGFDPIYVFSFALNYLVQVAVITFRFVVALSMTNSQIPFLSSLRTTLISGFFAQAVFNVVAGDAARVYLLRQDGVEYNRGTASVLLDRAVGLFSLLLLVAAGLPLVLSLEKIEDIVQGVFTVLSVGGLTFVATLLLGFWGKRIKLSGRLGEIVEGMTFARYLFHRPKLGIALLLLSIGLHLLNLFLFYLIAVSLGIAVEWSEILALVPPALVLSMLPISVSGWGVREGAVVVALGTVGVATESALAISVAFGLVLTVFNLPGGVVWLLSSGARVPSISPRKP